MYMHAIDIFKKAHSSTFIKAPDLNKPKSVSKRMENHLLLSAYTRESNIDINVGVFLLHATT